MQIEELIQRIDAFTKVTPGIFSLSDPWDPFGPTPDIKAFNDFLETLERKGPYCGRGGQPEYDWKFSDGRWLNRTEAKAEYDNMQVDREAEERGARERERDWLADRVTEFAKSIVSTDRSAAELGIELAGLIQESKRFDARTDHPCATKVWRLLKPKLKLIAAIGPPADPPTGAGYAVAAVTRVQIAAICGGLKKDVVAKWLSDGKIPAPDYPAENGQADKWEWANIRPHLQKIAPSIPMPERFPAQQFIN